MIAVVSLLTVIGRAGRRGRALSDYSDKKGDYGTPKHRLVLGVSARSTAAAATYTRPVARRLRVFVSSTMEDLANERDAVCRKLRSLHCEAVNAEALLPTG